MSIFKMIGLEPQTSPVKLLIELGRKFEYKFTRCKEEALSQVRSLWEKQSELYTVSRVCNIESLDLKKVYQNQTEGLKLQQEIEQFICDNKDLIRLAFENKNSHYAPYKFDDLLKEIEFHSSKTAAEAVNTFASIRLEKIDDQSSIWEAPFRCLRSFCFQFS